MGVEITPYTADHIDGVRQFNERLVRGGEGDYQLPERLPIPFCEGWLALQDGVVRGGYLLRRQEFSFDGQIREAAFYFLSASEGAIDRKYAPIGIRMVSSAVKNAPLTFALGMGGVDKRLPKLLKAFGWKIHQVPFLFRAVHPGRFVREITALRTTPFRRAALDVMAFSGAAWAAFGAVHAYRRKASSKVTAEVMPDFGPWADAVWQACGDSFAMTGVRDSRGLNDMYPAGMPRLSRLKVKDIGWAVVLNTRMEGHKQFGNLHVGTIVDCLSRHEDAPAVAAAAERFLESQGVDLIVSNQNHETWRAALLSRGFLEGPSNFVLALSKELVKLLEPLERNLTRIHMNRGDGDGPIHL